MTKKGEGDDQSIKRRLLYPMGIDDPSQYEDESDSELDFSQKSGDRRIVEIEASFKRADLRPPAIPQAGFSLETHYRATIIAQDLEPLDLKLPMEGLIRSLG